MKKELLVQKNFEKFGSKISLGTKNLGSKKFWVHKILGPKKCWVQKKFCVQKNFVSKKILGPKKLWVQKFESEKILSQTFLAPPPLFLRHRVKYGGLDWGFHSLALE